MGFTGQTLDARISQHFSPKGHLDSSCYNSVCKIEYKKYKTKCDAIVMETYYINLFSSKFNKQNKKNDGLTIEIDDKQEWKLYKTIREVKPIQYKSTDFVWKSIAFIYLIYMILKLVGKI